MKLKEEKIGSNKIYEGKIMDFYVDTVKLPSGKTATRELTRHCKASAVLAFVDENTIILEEQFRYPYDDTIIEIPACKADKDEDPSLTAERELREETGYQAGNLELLGAIYPSVAYTDEVIYIYLATGLSVHEQKLDEDENLNVFTVSFDEFRNMINDGRIKDAKTLAAFAFYSARNK